jgi:hypothetical protein
MALGAASSAHQMAQGDVQQAVRVADSVRLFQTTASLRDLLNGTSSRRREA